MGDDTPSAVLSKMYRPLSHFFRQNFSQVTNPPIDSLREYRVMSLKTRFGNLKNVLDEELQPDRDYRAGKPVHRQRAMGRSAGGTSTRPLTEIDCTFAPGKGEMQDGLRIALDRIRSEAEDAVRSGAGHLMLTDQHQGPRTASRMPMILATSAVHSHLTRNGLRTFCSASSVRSAECVDPHYFAVLIGCRRDGGQRLPGRRFSIAERIERGLLDGIA